MTLALVADLIFRSKIEAIAANVGANVTTGMPSPDLELPPGTTRVLVDLTAGGDPVDVIARFRAADPALEIIAFFPHVEIDRKKQAQAAGATKVLPRGTVVEQLPNLLSGS